VSPQKTNIHNSRLDPSFVQDLTPHSWQQAGLLKPSVLKPLIATLEQTQIVKVMGQLSATDQQGLQNTLQTILGQ